MHRAEMRGIPVSNKCAACRMTARVCRAGGTWDVGRVGVTLMPGRARAVAAAGCSAGNSMARSANYACELSSYVKEAYAERVWQDVISHQKTDFLTTACIACQVLELGVIPGSRGGI